MNVTRKATTVKLPDYLLADLHTEARRRNISMSKLLECIAEETMYIYAEETEEVHAV
jgi:predicted DNA-binding ribbon-helix-helix protein